MFFNSVTLSAWFVRVFFLTLVSFVFSTGIVIADWNSGVTIEEAATRVAINIADDGVQVTVHLSKLAIDSLQAAHPGNAHNVSDTKAIVDAFAKSIINIEAEQKLVPIIKTIDGSSDTIALKNTGDGGVVRDVFFPFSKRHPAELYIAPDFNALEKTGKTYLITVAHMGLPVIDHGVLTSAERLQLNWQDPWYSHFLNPKLKRGHRDPVMAFLYIEPEQIKSEIVVRVKEMANWTDLDLREDSLIYPDEYASLKHKVGQFLLKQNQVSADGKRLGSTLDQVDYIRMGAADIQAYEPQQAQRQVATLIGVSIIQHTKSLPEKVQWHWKLFNEKIQRIALRAYDPAGIFDSYVTPDYPVFEWENMLADIDLPDLADQHQSAPVMVSNARDNSQSYWSMGLLGLLFLIFISCRFISPVIRKWVQFSVLIMVFTGTYYLFQNDKIGFGLFRADLDERQAKPVVKQLLWNIYQAFESTQEDLVYDKLAFSISGDLQEKLYLQNRRMFLVEDSGLSKIKNIQIKSLVNHSSMLSEVLQFDCEWLVTGEVIHWGHQHQRENLYRATIKIVPINGVWKIIEINAIGQQRMDSQNA